MAQLHFFLLGVLVTCCVVAGTFFLRFWQKTTDRLFAVFAVSFFLLGLNWLLLAFTQRDETRDAMLYMIRLLAFVLLLIGIVDKNRARSRRDRVD